MLKATFEGGFLPQQAMFSNLCSLKHEKRFDMLSTCMEINISLTWVNLNFKILV